MCSVMKTIVAVWTDELDDELSIAFLFNIMCEDHELGLFEMKMKKF